MGGGQSAPEEGGFRIFKVNAGSPAFEAGLEVFFDFIIEINGVKVESDQTSFFEKIKAAENQRTKLVVYNIRTHSYRDATVTPRQWGGSGLLGAVVRYDSLENTENQGIRVLEVFPNSPSAIAGIVPFKDFLLGTADVMFRDIDELVEIVQLCLGKRMQIYVYNCDTETIREVYIVPNNNWGGDGAIGCDIRSGLLHRIPPPRKVFAGFASAAGIAPAVAAPPGMPPVTVQLPAGVAPPPAPVSNGAVPPALSAASLLPPGAAAPPPMGGVAAPVAGTTSGVSPHAPAGQIPLAPRELVQHFDMSTPMASPHEVPVAIVATPALQGSPPSAVLGTEVPLPSIVFPPVATPTHLAAPLASATLPAMTPLQGSVAGVTAVPMPSPTEAQLPMNMEETHSPHRQASPSTPAVTRAPPSTPMHAGDAAEMDPSVALMSPGTVNIPHDLAARTLTTSSFDGTLAPGVIYETS